MAFPAIDPDKQTQQPEEEAATTAVEKEELAIAA